MLTAVPAAIVLALLSGRIARRWAAHLEQGGGHEPSRRGRVLMHGLAAVGDGVEEAVVLPPRWT